MVDITTDKAPGWYSGAIAVNITFPPNSRKAIITRDDRSPVLSEIIAYDKDPNTQAPRPFLAVTQDGRGNVMYDGGFPKYYNSHLSGRPVSTTFAMLNGACKLLHNAMKFCANKTKVAAGNKKILVIGNVNYGTSFCVKYSVRKAYGPDANAQNTGMADSFDETAAVAGYTLTYMLPSDIAGGKINLNFNQLDQYAAVLFLSSAYINDGTTMLGPTFAKDLAAYRAQGNGIMIITDHSEQQYTSLADAVARHSGFCNDAILLAAEYGAYFSGNYDRTNVRVGDIRTELGDHPLFAGMADDDIITGQESESIVYVEDHAADQVNPAVVQTFNLSTAGSYRINALVQMNDGTILTLPLRYDLIDPSNVLLRDTRNRTIGTTLTTGKRCFDLNMFYNVANAPTLTGYVTRNGIKHGTFVLDGSGAMSIKWCSGTGSPFAFSSTDKIGFSIEFPFLYNVESTATLRDITADKKLWTQIAPMSNALKQWPDYTGLTVKDSLEQYWNHAKTCYTDEGETGGNVYRIWSRVLPKVGRSLNGVLGSCRLWIATNPPEWITTKPANPLPGDTAIVGTTNVVYTWWVTNGVGAWVSGTENAAAFFGVGRKVYNTRDNSLWLIQANATVKQ